MAFPARWLASMRSQDYELGITSFDSGHYEEAISHFECCLNSSPDAGTARLARFYIGESCSALGASACEARAWEKADAWLTEAAKHQPTHADVKFWLAYVKRKRGLPAEALTIIAQALEINPNYCRAILLQALLWFESGRQADAISRIHSAGRHDSTLDFRLVQEGIAAQANKDTDSFLLYIERALQERSTSSEAVSERGDVAFREGRYQDALEQYSRGLEVSSGYADLHCKQGQCFLELGMPEDALESLNCALEINPHYIDAQYHAARALMSLRRTAEAKALLQEILTHVPEHSPARDLLERDAA